jgi:hypothetical protein
MAGSYFAINSLLRSGLQIAWCSKSPAAAGLTRVPIALVSAGRACFFQHLKSANISSCVVGRAWVQGSPYKPPALRLTAKPWLCVEQSLDEACDPGHPCFRLRHKIRLCLFYFFGFLTDKFSVLITGCAATVFSTFFFFFGGLFGVLSPISIISSFVASDSIVATFLRNGNHINHYFPQHFLNFLPLPQEHGSFLPVSGLAGSCTFISSSSSSVNVDIITSYGVLDIPNWCSKIRRSSSL